MIIEDIRSYIFPLIIAEESEGTVKWDTHEFLGTGFFITRNGVALAAGHCVPSSEDLKSKTLYAGVWLNGQIELCHVAAKMVFDDFDIAILKVKTLPEKYFEVSFDNILPGTDIWAVGIPAHDIREGKRIVRCLKGNVTFLSRFAELSFPALRGMSGSPVGVDNKVAGVLIGNVKSEELEDSFEKVVTLSDEREVIKFVETKSIINYSLAQELKPFKEMKHEVFEDNSFSEFIKNINKKQS